VVILALDIGGTKLAAALWDGQGLRDRQEISTPADRSPEGILNACLELLRPKLSLASNLGVAATGTVAEGRVTALNSETLHGWLGFDVQRWLEERTGLPTRVLNDADAAAWGEFVRGAGRDTRDFAFVTVSTGIGGGLVLNRQLLTTPHGLHAEFGFTLTDDDSPLEFVASGVALDKAARDLGWADARDVVRRALESDASAQALLDSSAKRVARLLGNVRALLGVERVVVGGGLGLASSYLERVRAHLERLGSPWSDLEVVRAELGVDAGLIGAALWVEQG
jgi:N-acylmannosamine kinase